LIDRLGNIAFNLAIHAQAAGKMDVTLNSGIGTN
jgi:hypothetical protein